jgi:hypothetical protein
LQAGVELYSSSAIATTFGIDNEWVVNEPDSFGAIGDNS